VQLWHCSAALDPLAEFKGAGKGQRGRERRDHPLAPPLPTSIAFTYDLDLIFVILAQTYSHSIWLAAWRSG